MGNKPSRNGLVRRLEPRHSEADNEFLIWYRHSGEEEVQDIPYDCDLKKVVDYREIMKSVEFPHHITHIHIALGPVMPPLHIICPHLTHLRISNVDHGHNLNCIGELSNLEVLRIWDSNFSSGLHEVISTLESLRVLELDTCQLKNLPNSLGDLQKLSVLRICNADFSKDFPEVIAQIRSLRTLELDTCRLTYLPQGLEALQQLEALHIAAADFSDGLPDVISQLVSLQMLKLDTCQLTDMPQSLSSLQGLHTLNLHGNGFIGELPTVIYQLSHLQTLDMAGNSYLYDIDRNLLTLGKLQNFYCDGCESLNSPPYAVCEQGLTAIHIYFNELEEEAGTELIAVPVAVVGNLMAGKTSLIRSLKQGKRELTFREKSSPLDETTKVFKIESLKLTDSLVKFIDYGGHEVYHMAHQLTLKDQCIPTIVVNLEEYHKLSNQKGHREATRRLCIDWLCHLYLACPRLGAPILALTHRDKLSHETFELCINQLLSSAETIRLELLKEEKELSGDVSEFCQVKHLSNLNRPLFDSDEIFVFSNDMTANTDIDNLKESLERRCQEFKVTIPRLWERVSSYLEEMINRPYALLSEIKEKFDVDDQVEIILRYLHNTGRILWFENMPALSEYIFHQVPEIVEMIALLFHHSGDELWNKRVSKATAFKHKNHIIEKEMYEQLVRQFKEDGALNECILANMLKSETKFPAEIGLELLRSFHIIHGPVQHKGGNSYIIPYFSTNYMDREWQSDGYVQLRVDVKFNGLPLPRYAYQLITVAILKHHDNPTYSIKVANNGATIRHGRRATHLVHDYNNGKVTLQVSTPVELIGSSWQHLIELIQCIINNTSKVWKAIRPVFVFYCSHCLFMRETNPDFEINPSWFRSTHQCRSGNNQLPSMTIFPGLEPVACSHAESHNSGELTVPKPLRFPCSNELTHSEVSKLERYLHKLKGSRPSLPTDVTKSLSTRSPYTDDSDISDVEEEGYADFNTCVPELSLRLIHTEKAEIQALFDNTDEVYHMSDPIRGRVMIINNKNFYEGEKLIDTRDGSEVDCANLAVLFKRLRFEMVKSSRQLSDLKAEEVYSKIKQETHLPEHHSYGCFFLVLMSHGTRGDKLYDCHFQPIDLVKIKDLLSPSNFPAMKGKPKVIIIQACSGDRIDFGNAAATPPTSQTQPAAIPPTSPAPPAAIPPTSPTKPDATNQQQEPLNIKQRRKAEEEQRCGGPSADFSKLDTLNADDFFITKATTESYKAVRSNIHGSWFIRILVATFYKHSCHRDIEELFKIIQDRVRKVSMAHTKSTGKPLGGCVPDSRCTFTNFRKLYLFPGYPPK